MPSPSSRGRRPRYEKHRDHRRDPGAQRRVVPRRHRARRDQPAGAGGAADDVEGVRAHRELAHRGVPHRDVVAHVQREGEPLREPPAEPWLPEGRQGGDPPDELPGVAARLLRHPQGGLHGRAAQLPLHRRRDQVLPDARRREGARVRAGVHRARRADHRRDPARAGAVLRGGRLPHLRRLLQDAPLLLRGQGTDRAADFGGRGGDLLLLRHDRLPQGHRPPAPLPRPRLPRRAEPPRPDEGRRLPLHPAALPHGREDALVRLVPRRRTRRPPEGRQARVDPPRRLRGALHHRLAARAVGAGHPRRD